MFRGTLVPFITLVLSLLQQTAWAVTPLETPEDILSTLVEETKPFMKTLSRDVSVFHYEEDADLSKEYTNPDNPEWAARMNTSIQDNFWDPTVASSNDGWLGGGLYAAARNHESPLIL